MGSNKNKTLVQDYLDAHTDGDLAKLRSLIADDLAYHFPRSVELSLNMKSTLHGGDAYVQTRKEAFSRIYKAGPRTLVMHHMLSDGDMVAAFYTVRATTAAGAPYENEYSFLYRIEDGKISEMWEHTDTARALHQFGYSIEKP